MSICVSCRLALRQSLRPRAPRAIIRHTSTNAPRSPAEILSQPTWSVRSLLEDDPDTPSETITPTQLHHLLRLSALPLPTSPDEEKSMLATLQDQLRFVRAIQRVDTRGVEPLRSIRDETPQGVKEGTIGLADLKGVLDKEVKIGHYQRPRRVKVKVKEEAEEWDVLGTASRKVGRYFVVESGKKEGAAG